MAANEKHDKLDWHFDNSYVCLPSQLFTPTKPTPVTNPRVIIINQKLVKNLGLNFQSLSDQEIAELLAGNILLAGMEPIALAYAGHQYGHFTMLGDGRAVLLGEYVTPDNKRVDIQLKGSGQTPYSRRGDGRAALGPMLREYIISEAMYALGIPTTRSLAVIDTGEPVYREKTERGAILTRVADSHIRIGTFEYLAAQQDLKTLKILIDYTIARHFPEINNTENPALALLRIVAEQQINLIVDWMRVGFIHGVMNTDNVSIAGETIDYGPCAFMDEYDAKTVFSAIDRQGRYAYENQAKIIQWNLARFAECLLPFLDGDAKQAVTLAEEIIAACESQYQQCWLDMMRRKLGLINKEVTDLNLINDFLAWMQNNNEDYTNAFLALREPSRWTEKLTQDAVLNAWYQRWQQRLKQDHTEEDAINLMRANNPAVIPRNHLVQSVLDAATNQQDMVPFNNFIKILTTPYTNSMEAAPYQGLPNPQEKVLYTFCGT